MKVLKYHKSKLCAANKFKVRYLHYRLILLFLDIDECNPALASPSCGVNGDCVNFIGSFTCICHTGYALQDDGVTCEGKYNLDYVLPINSK